MRSGIEKRALVVLAPSPRVTVVCPLPMSMRSFAELVLQEPAVNLVLTGVTYKKSDLAILAGHVLDLLHALKHRITADVCILMSDSNSFFGVVKYTAISGLSCRAGIRFAIAPRQGSFPLHENVVLDENVQKMKRYFDFAQSVLFRLKIKSRQSWRDYLPQMRTRPAVSLAVLAPGGKWDSQRWPYFRELCKWLSSQNLKCVLVGSADEAQLINDMRQLGQEVVAGADLSDVKAAIERATIVVCNDSGLLHLAVWSGVPVIAICGPRFAARWTGYPEDRVVQLYYDRVPEGRESARYRAECLSKIGVDRVISEIKKLNLDLSPKVHT